MSTIRPIVDGIMFNLLDDSTHKQDFKDRNSTSSLKPPFISIIIFIRCVRVSILRYDVQDLLHDLLKLGMTSFLVFKRVFKNGGDNVKKWFSKLVANVGF